MGPQSDSVVVVLGSLHYDILLDAPHLPRRGETVTGSRWFPKFGGKGGNQAVAALRAGAQTRLVGAVGQDAFGAFIRAHLDQVGLSPEFIATHPDLPTGMSVAISETDGDYGAVIVSGVNSQIDPARLDDPAIWRDAGILLLQNEMREDLNLAASRMARARGARVCLNAAPARALSQELAAGIDVLIVNALEAEALCRRAVTDLISAGDAARDLARRFACAIVTAGGAGLAGCARGEAVIRVAAEKVELVSTHGAGDAFTGAFCAALAQGRALEPALRRANAAAADQVSKRDRAFP